MSEEEDGGATGAAGSDGVTRSDWFSAGAWSSTVPKRQSSPCGAPKGGSCGDASSADQAGNAPRSPRNGSPPKGWIGGPSLKSNGGSGGGAPRPGLANGSSPNRSGSAPPGL
ncbi:hypothetical protein ACIU1J_02105 [Azospirillum doebereinerae]|uniref:hypothetical protein n=1 Tax=Azospirillum doebereinerae TaxID=92933 RepID=UPI00385073A9